MYKYINILMSSFNTKYINKKPNITKANNLEVLKISKQQLKKIETNKQNLINILIRTTYRPKYFNTCINSIYKQKYDNYKIICCYDDERCLNYLKEYTNRIEYFFIDIESKSSHKYNRYCNHLMNVVNDGWIMFLDDDDKLANNKSLSIINNALTNENNILFWKVKIGNDIIIPINPNKIMEGQIDTNGFCFHSKYKNLNLWREKRAGDLSFITGLLKKKNFNKIRIPYVLVSTISNKSNNGMQNYYDFKDFVKNKNIKQIYLSKSLCFLKDKMKDQFDLQEYNSKNDICIFFGAFNEDDFLTIKEHQGKKFVMFNGNDIKNYKSIECVNFLTLSKKMKDYLIHYKIFSRLIKLDIK